MSRYSPADEEKIRAQALVREWTRSGLLDESQKGRLEGDLQVDLRRTNYFLRAVVFVFTILVVAASIALVGTTLRLDDKVPFAIMCFISGSVCYALAEYLINRFRIYRFGVEEALAVAAVLLMAIGGVVITDTIGESRTLELPVIVGLSVGAAGAFAIYGRFGYLYAALASMICVAALSFQFRLSLAAERSLAATILLLVFLVVRPRRLSHGDDFPGDDYGVIQASALAGLYLALNLQLTGHPATGAFYWVTYAMIWIVPIIAFSLALSHRDRPLLDVSVGMALATLVTNKPYLGLERRPWDPVLFGIFLVAVAITIRRWLSRGTSGQRYGFTSARVLSGDRRVLTLVGTASAALQSDVPVSASTPSKPEFGGGRSGGGGASGSF